MKTAMQELIEHIESNEIVYNKDLILKLKELLEKEKEQLGQFLNWFIKHYSTTNIDGFFGWADSMGREVTIKDILDDYYNKKQIENGAK